MPVLKPGDAIPALAALGIALAVRGPLAAGIPAELLLVTPEGSSVLALSCDTLMEVQVRDGTLLVQIEGGMARIVSSPCPRGTCVETGWIREPGRTAVCMPEGVFIQVLGEREVPDAVTY